MRQLEDNEWKPSIHANGPNLFTLMDPNIHWESEWMEIDGLKRQRRRPLPSLPHFLPASPSTSPPLGTLNISYFINACDHVPTPV